MCHVLTLLLGTAVAFGVKSANAACPNASAPLHGGVGNCSSTTPAESGQCTYTCDEGYQCSSPCTDTPCVEDCTRMCVGDSYDPALVCSPKTCPLADVRSAAEAYHLNTTISCSTGDLLGAMTSGQHCQVTGASECQSGYQASGELRISCTAGHVSISGSCDEVSTCPNAAKAPLHGGVGSCSSTTPAESGPCTYTCDEGYQCSSPCTDTPCAEDCTRTCVGDSYDPALVCSPKTCFQDLHNLDLPPHMTEGNVTEGTSCTHPLLDGHSCVPGCADGYELQTDEGTSGGEWTCDKGHLTINAQCVAAGCSEADVRSAAAAYHLNTTISCSTGDLLRAMTSGQHCQVTGASECQSGYQASGELRISCSSTVPNTVSISGSCAELPCNCTNGCNTVQYGDAGDCPYTMPGNSSCTPTCDGGYEAEQRHCSEGRAEGGRCTPKTCNATGIGSEYEPQGARDDDGTCNTYLSSGHSCTPECKHGYEIHSCTPDCKHGYEIPGGQTTCLLGEFTSVSFCEKPKPKLRDFKLTPVANNSTRTTTYRPGMTTVLYLGLVGIVMCGCCGTCKMASAKITKDEYDSVTDWSRLE